MSDHAGAACLADHDDPFLRDLSAGLAARPRSISPKYFYDQTGSALFDRICALPEYYPTRTEVALLSRHASEMVEVMGACCDLIEFGAGSLSKVRLLLQAFSRSGTLPRYLPIDISGSHLREAADGLRAEFPDLTVKPVVADYTASLEQPLNGHELRQPVGFFPGSTIGNLDPQQTQQFLRRSASLLRGGGLLVGVDLVKAPALLHAAYNDSEGVTAEFNRNLLRRANRELGADFDPEAYDHYAHYNPLLQCVEMHLVSRRRQVVTLAGQRYLFDQGDAIHTENSRKYTIGGFQALAVQAGFVPGQVWVDPDQLFSVHWLTSPGSRD